jgi:hypothetical protein
VTLKILDLFSGLGGFSLGLERTGHFKTIAFCDNNKYCNLVLQKHWKGVKIYNDVKEITKERLETDGVEAPDIITGGFPCQPFSVAGKQKGTVTTDISGLRCFESSKSLPRGGLLEKMSKALLTSKTAWSSRLCALTWKERDTKSGRSIFQLQVSVLPTEEKESGLWLTPNATIRPTRSEEAMKKREEYRKSIGRTTVPPGSLAEQVQYGKATTDMKMFPTPTTQEIEHPNMKLTKTGRRLTKDGKNSHSLNLADTVKMWRTPDAHCNRGPSSEKRMKMKLEKGMPISINDQVAHPNLMWPTPSQGMWKQDVNDNGEYAKRVKDKGHQVMLPAAVKLREPKRNWPTPTARDWKDSGKAVVNSHRSSLPQTIARDNKEAWVKGGGALNPTWVEWLMGYPAGYTDLKDWAILSSRKSSKK